jgi:hypothetical protein
VAWANKDDLQNFDMRVRTGGGVYHTVPLYTTPPQRQWVGLTDEDLEFWGGELDQGELGKGVLRAVEKHLKEKNA